jgi:type III restriction enzyme
MPDSVIPYEETLPFNSERSAYREPNSYLVKDGLKYKKVPGRRPSKMFLVPELRKAVRKWRDSDYAGATHTSSDLLKFWFEEEHTVNGEPFTFYFCQREAIETIIYLVEVEGYSDLVSVIKKYADKSQNTLLADDMVFESPDGRRSVRRFFPEREQEGTQELPERNLLRYAIKMATGTGKTFVMALVMVWSYFNKVLENKQNMADNFLLVAPNVIVLERLEKDFLDNSIFKRLPLIPGYLRNKWHMKVITRGDTSAPSSSGNLFLQNIQQLYESRDVDRWQPANAVQAFLGRPAQKEISRSTLSVLHHVKRMQNLIVMNDEAHHVHQEELAWNKTLLSIHHTLPGGLRLWLDFSATPKDQNGTYFPWIVVDYPLAEAVEDAVVKAPIILHEDLKSPETITKENVTKVYHPWITSAVERWREHKQYYVPFDKKPVLFIMAEKNAFADEIAKMLRDEMGFRNDEVLLIHTDNEGEVRKSELEELREKAREIDEPKNKIKIVVSVLMLREGWDVQNVTITLGLRPFTAKAEILPEQAVGRGLRIIPGISTDTRQTLEVMGTPEFERFVRELEQEGVGISTFDNPPPFPITVSPEKAKLQYDIVIPQTEPFYSRDYKQLSLIDPAKIDSLKESNLLADIDKTEITMEYAITETYLGTIRIEPTYIPPAAVLLSHITNDVIKRARLLGSDFSELYPIIRRYIEERCFGKKVDVEEERVRRKLLDSDVESAIVSILAKVLGQISVRSEPMKLKQASIHLSLTPPFVWRRKHVECKHTVFNYVATYNDFESRFAEFLEKSRDISAFASFAERNVHFEIDYLTSRGAISSYYPDFVAVQKNENRKVNWIIETKGREYPDTDKKQAAIENWCRLVSEAKGEPWVAIKVPQEVFDKHVYYDFSELVKYVESAQKSS